MHTPTKAWFIFSHLAVHNYFLLLLFFYFFLLTCCLILHFASIPVHMKASTRPAKPLVFVTVVVDPGTKAI